ncbi:hypothetical protein L226DRAFT_534310 [Lentinus tigrinus ALCF2SS1-7]|uniref:uncharacterized protein n=1 Tax=Lentinus tigrinus ALCF2SS1-7 TaxID=1328758 RepID=UPI001165F8A7|nr:hypothetical protein L226DRAFT_534310 [Lentinus tigrinus ALCF2SS1-7]
MRSVSVWRLPTLSISRVGGVVGIFALTLGLLRFLLCVRNTLRSSQQHRQQTPTRYTRQ